MFNFDYVVHEGKFIEFVHNEELILADVKSFCFINSLLEKVVTNCIVNVDDYLKGEKKIIEERTFTYPEIHDALKMTVMSRITSPDNHQCLE